MIKNERIVNVFLNLSIPKVKVGILAFNNGKIFFEYDDKFLKTNLELSPYALPLKKGVYQCDDSTVKGLWGLFNDSIPSGLEQLIIDEHLKKENIDPLDITPLDRLCYTGNYTIGALSYEPKYKENNVDIILNNLTQLTHNVIIKKNKEDLIELFSSNSCTSPEIDYKVPIQHHKSKTSIKPITMLLDKDYLQTFIKFISPSECKESGILEYAYSLMAKDAQLEMSTTRLITKKYFTYARFDFQENKRLHVHTVAGLLPDDIINSSFDYDDLLTLTLDLTKDVREQEKVFRLACFNLFASNRNDHAKNFSFIMNKNGIWKFAPSYNITYSEGLNGEHYTKYLGEGKNPTTNHLMDLGSRHMINQFKEIIEEVKTSIGNWLKFSEEANLSHGISHAILDVHSERLNS